MFLLSYFYKIQKQVSLLASKPECIDKLMNKLRSSDVIIYILYNKISWNWEPDEKKNEMKKNYFTDINLDFQKQTKQNIMQILDLWNCRLLEQIKQVLY